AAPPTPRPLPQREVPPPAGPALQLRGSPVREVKVGAGDQVPHRRGDKHFARARERSNPRSDVDGEARDLVADELTLAGVQTGPDLEAKLPHAPATRLRPAHRTDRT